MSFVGEGVCCYCGEQGVNDTDPDICLNCIIKRKKFRESFSKSDIENQMFTCLMKDTLFDTGVEVSMKLDLSKLNEFFAEFLKQPEFSQILITKHIEPTKNKIVSREPEKN